jgi:hypothetical protein
VNKSMTSKYGSIDFTCKLCSKTDAKVVYYTPVKDSEDVFICGECKAKVRDKTGGVIHLDVEY